jgi:hypothetical protein
MLLDVEYPFMVSVNDRAVFILSLGITFCFSSGKAEDILSCQSCLPAVFVAG